jgi:hypothetical protein
LGVTTSFLGTRLAPELALAGLVAWRAREGLF